ncbi:MAG: glycosyl hydrolase family 31 [Bacteroidaceae bacterium]|nr:glycosyl hydrolase family 31 [Bacteroidaceae bacterium]
MFKFINYRIMAAVAICLCLNSCAKKQYPGPANGIFHDGLEFETVQGLVTVTALTDNAFRIRCIPKGIELPEMQELIYTEKIEKPKITFIDGYLAGRYAGRSGGRHPKATFKGGNLKPGPTDRYELGTENGRGKVLIDGVTGLMTFTDADGNIILEEVPDSRCITAGRTGSLNSLSVSQGFRTDADEFITGLGQFQDGYLNNRGLTRRLTQVNTQISIPMIISNKGYGILWNNYGLTDYNPSDFTVELKQGGESGQTVTVNATGTLGNVRERRSFNDFTGEFTVKEDGQYSILLDVGQAMARKQFMTIDGDTVFNVNNTWLPPTTSAIVSLEKGTHKVRVSGSRGDKPTVGVRKVTDRTVFSSPVATALDYTVFLGTPDEIISDFRTLTGHVPAMPEWAFGYIHCRERYDSQTELLENATRFRTDSIPVDVIVQDWQWWGKYGWNAMQFDEDKYPDPKAMTDSLHDMGIKLMLSVWSKIDRNCQVGSEMLEKGYYIDGTDWIDFFNPDAANKYWQEFSARLLPTGIDAWWQDATEPENDDLSGRMVTDPVTGGMIPGEFYRNAYPNMVNKTVYEGLRKDQPDRDPMILTRSGFTGIQRYGAVNWSGDVGNDWETLRRQIAGGLSLMATGQPWWTFDAGGFFRPGNQYTDADYQERMIRWIQTSVFLPFMRVHGYMSQTEPWRYPDETRRIFENQIRLRYKLLPYILESAKMVTEQDYTMMRPLVFDFPHDSEALKQQTQFMFGPSLMVCPVTEPGVKEWKVYLPKSDRLWHEMNTGATYDTSTGGMYVSIPVTLEYIPVFNTTNDAR